MHLQRFACTLDEGEYVFMCAEIFVLWSWLFRVSFLVSRLFSYVSAVCVVCVCVYVDVDVVGVFGSWLFWEADEMHARSVWKDGGLGVALQS